MAELLTRKIATEYRDKALFLSNSDMQDIGERRALRIELQTRCNLTELAAVNIINGYNISDYVIIEKQKEQERIKKELRKNRRKNNAVREKWFCSASGRHMAGDFQ